MELQAYIVTELEGLQRTFHRVTGTLTQQEVAWRPASGCNSIGILLLHMARFEDTFVNARMQNKPELWTADKWYERLKLAESDAGSHYTVDQVNAFKAPDLKDVLAPVLERAGKKSLA